MIVWWSKMIRMDWVVGLMSRSRRRGQRYGDWIDFSWERGEEVDTLRVKVMLHVYFHVVARRAVRHDRRWYDYTKRWEWSHRSPTTSSEGNCVREVMTKSWTVSSKSGQPIGRSNGDCESQSVLWWLLLLDHGSTTHLAHECHSRIKCISW
jgi:hypothetical protein